MKKAENEMRAAYKRFDFRNLERGRFYQEVAKGTSVVLLDPELGKTSEICSRYLTSATLTTSSWGPTRWDSMVPPATRATLTSLCNRSP
jgi:hypothetical protein